MCGTKLQKGAKLQPNYASEAKHCKGLLAQHRTFHGHPWASVRKAESMDLFAQSCVHVCMHGPAGPKKNFNSWASVSKTELLGTVTNFISVQQLSFQALGDLCPRPTQKDNAQ